MASPPASSAAPSAAHLAAPLPSWALELLAVTPPPTEAPAPSAASPPLPMRQISPITIALAFTPGTANGFQLALDPAELGRVEIRVQRDGESHSVRVTAERPETLALLLRDRQELDRSLSDAGLRVEAKGIEFTLGAPSGGSDQRPQGEARAGASRAGRARPGTLTETEPTPPARAQRGLLDLNI
jgi:Meckel syndrome type 1 protein